MEAPAPPNLRLASETTDERCATCTMFDVHRGVCWGYGDYDVEPDYVCDSYDPENVQSDADKGPRGDDALDGSSSPGNLNSPGIDDATGSISSKQPVEGRDLLATIDLEREQLRSMTADERRAEALSYSNLQSILYDALSDDVPGVSSCDVWIVDFGPDWVVWEAWPDLDLYQQSFTLDGNVATLVGEPQEVVQQVSYEAVSERVNAWVYAMVTRAKYTQDEIDELGKRGHAFKNDDGSYSYPIGDAEDLGNAIHAVGRGDTDHDAIREYIIGRAKDLGEEDDIPDNWNSDGSLKEGASTELEDEERAEKPEEDRDLVVVVHTDDDDDDDDEDEDEEDESEDEPSGATSSTAPVSRRAAVMKHQGRRYKARHRSTPAPKPEFRIRVTNVEVRSSSGHDVVLEGEPIVYDTPYVVHDMLGKFTERMRPTVCEALLAQGTLDCRFLFNHDGMPLARTTSGTLELDSTAESLRCVANIDTRQFLANDLSVAVERGDVSQMSVGFIVAEDSWDDSYMERDVYRFADMPDVSAVTYPASPTTSLQIAQRMLLGVPPESRARIREAYKLMGSVRAGRTLNATNAALISSALEALHRADDVDLDEIVSRLQDVDSALDQGMEALAAVSGVPNPDDDEDEDEDVEEKESDEQREEREAAEADQAEVDRVAEERELAQAAERRRRQARARRESLAVKQRRR